MCSLDIGLDVYYNTKEVVDSRTDGVRLIGFIVGYICKLRIAEELSNNTGTRWEPPMLCRNLAFEVIETADTTRSADAAVLHVLPSALIGIELR